ncbi:hypothetical protein PUNSTDRAFT_127964 [Punctularia strigosozonata HHB-11173 SS5]|uniref:Fungal-type protein kinase domain-containing protein n=1 Tax=Punctularia strigosozonata (strain HHB-11173) TaxID=741275 RepID=R7S599_PUNST|nr:uncharacterized protein PUNSTDRAFT_127964 [Punctularia strigosozonata HHB-11173 SS5]EIN05072.1 hypothetical protein PUNSTDRAFT_127964 [Punctularia strigosozonata HHB-11173 SS5]
MVRKRRYAVRPSAGTTGVVHATTPPKTSEHHEQSRHLTTVDKMRAMVSDELEDHAFVVPTERFIDCILSEDPQADADVAAAVFDKLTTGQKYAADRWSGFPSDGATESELYLPFIRIATHIGAVLKELDPERKPGTHVAWSPRPDTVLKSLHKNAAQLRPDIVAVIGEQDAVDQMQKDAHWVRVHTPVEVKRAADAKTVAEGVAQLCRYIRMVLGDQLDRRFALGMLLCGSKLSVWLCDKSGLIGTRNMIDIHKQPKQFIRVIMALSRLPPSRLGWDPDMLLITPSGRILPSTDPSVGYTDFRSSLYDTKWQITVQSVGTEHVLVTEKALSIVRAASLSGSGTVIWRVGEKANVEKKYVLKRIWRLATAPTEEQVRSRLGDTPRVCKIKYSRDAFVAGSLDNTEDSIRKGLKPEEGDRVAVDQDRPGKRSRAEAEGDAGNDDASNPEKYIHIAAEDRLVIVGVHKPDNRVRCYTLMETFGKPIKFFDNVSQLLHALKDAVEGHQELWFSGSLHRDISPGNILIVEDDQSEEDAGSLIDLEHGKILEDLMPMPLPCKDRRQCQKLVDWYEDRPGVDVSFEQAEDLLGRYQDPDNVVEHVKKARGAGMSAIREDFIAPKNQYFDVRNTVAASKTRTGTKAFMSGELLSQHPYAHSTDNRPGCGAHDVLHDVESFFWVLVYLVITREGYEGHRRPELLTNTPSLEEETIQNVTYCLFDAADELTLRDNKKDLFLNPEDFKLHILPMLNPRLESKDVLAELVENWWKLLVLTYLTYDLYTPGVIHDQVLSLLRTAIDKIAAVPGESSPRYPQTETRTWEFSPSKRVNDSSAKPATPKPQREESPTPAPKRTKIGQSSSPSLMG